MVFFRNQKGSMRPELLMAGPQHEIPWPRKLWADVVNVHCGREEMWSRCLPKMLYQLRWWLLVFLSKRAIRISSFFFNNNRGFYLGVSIPLARERSLRIVFQTMNTLGSELVNWCHTVNLISMASYMVVKTLHCFSILFICLFLILVNNVYLFPSI